MVTEGLNYRFKHNVYTGYANMFNLKFQKKLCVPSYDALKDMARHNVLPVQVETIIIDGDDFQDPWMKKYG